MSGIVSYKIGRGGNVWVTQPDGVVRKATPREWLAIFEREPALTLRLIEHGA